MIRTSTLFLIASYLSCALFICGCGNQSQPPTIQQPPTPPPAQQAKPWSEFTFPNAGFAITAPFPPQNFPYEGQPGYSQAWSWTVGNPDFNLAVVVQELGTFLHDEDAQRRIMQPAAAASMQKIGVEDYSVEWTRTDDRLVIVAHGLNPDNHRVWLRALMANKAIYMMIADEVGEDDATATATRLLDSFRLLPDYPTAIPDAEAAENLPIFIDQALTAEFDPELAAMIEDNFNRGEDPGRGIHYQGEFNQPELTQQQAAQLRKIMDTMQVPNPLPWETWVHDVRIQFAPTDATLLRWGRVCLAWISTADTGWTSEFNSWVLEALYFSESASDEKARDFMQFYGFTQDLQNRLLFALREPTDMQVIAWLNAPPETRP